MTSEAYDEIIRASNGRIKLPLTRELSSKVKSTIELYSGSCSSAVDRVISSASSTNSLVSTGDALGVPGTAAAAAKGAAKGKGSQQHSSSSNGSSNINGSSSSSSNGNRNNTTGENDNNTHALALCRNSVVTTNTIAEVECTETSLVMDTAKLPSPAAANGNALTVSMEDGVDRLANGIAYGNPEQSVETSAELFQTSAASNSISNTLACAVATNSTTIPAAPTQGKKEKCISKGEPKAPFFPLLHKLINVTSVSFSGAASKIDSNAQVTEAPVASAMPAPPITKMSSLSLRQQQQQVQQQQPGAEGSISLKVATPFTAEMVGPNSAQDSDATDAAGATDGRTSTSGGEGESYSSNNDACTSASTSSSAENKNGVSADVLPLSSSTVVSHSHPHLQSQLSVPQGVKFSPASKLGTVDFSAQSSAKPPKARGSKGKVVTSAVASISTSSSTSSSSVRGGSSGEASGPVSTAPKTIAVAAPLVVFPVSNSGSSSISAYPKLRDSTMAYLAVRSKTVTVDDAATPFLGSNAGVAVDGVHSNDPSKLPTNSKSSGNETAVSTASPDTFQAIAPIVVTEPLSTIAPKSATLQRRTLIKTNNCSKGVASNQKRLVGRPKNAGPSAAAAAATHNGVLTEAAVATIRNAYVAINKNQRSSTPQHALLSAGAGASVSAAAAPAALGDDCLEDTLEDTPDSRVASRSSSSSSSLHRSGGSGTSDADSSGVEFLGIQRTPSATQSSADDGSRPGRSIGAGSSNDESSRSINSSSTSSSSSINNTSTVSYPGAGVRKPARAMSATIVGTRAVAGGKRPSAAGEKSGGGGSSAKKSRGNPRDVSTSSNCNPAQQGFVVVID
jgi:trimeric autotransporter adhesin